MELVAIVAALALIQYLYFAVRVGRARGTYGVKAPAVTGHPAFERHHRVHQNTLEQLVLLLPGLWLFATYVNPGGAAALGLLFVIGRAVYAQRYVAAPETRGPGSILTTLAVALLLLGGLIGAILRLV
ncbi:MAG: MAPEG family protein [Deltaproteobacteria bacterium]|nr:MAG: MAPEG family protein [Deltaproteobacteria bacterium]